MMKYLKSYKLHTESIEPTSSTPDDVEENILRDLDDMGLELEDELNVEVTIKYDNLDDVSLISVYVSSGSEGTMKDKYDINLEDTLEVVDRMINYMTEKGYKHTYFADVATGRDGRNQPTRGIFPETVVSKVGRDGSDATGVLARVVSIRFSKGIEGEPSKYAYD